MAAPLNLPPGYAQRPLVPGDAAAVTAAMAASELADIGRVEIEEADIVGAWRRPSYDVCASSVGVFTGETLVAYAECCGSFPRRRHRAPRPPRPRDRHRPGGLGP